MSYKLTYFLQLVCENSVTMFFMTAKGKV